MVECESHERSSLATDNMFRHQTEERSLYADDPVSPSEFPLGLAGANAVRAVAVFSICGGDITSDYSDLFVRSRRAVSAKPEPEMPSSPATTWEESMKSADYSSGPKSTNHSPFRAAQSIPRRINVRIGATSNSAAV